MPTHPLNGISLGAKLRKAREIRRQPFSVSLTIYALLSGLSILVVVGIVLLPLVVFMGLILTCIGAYQASEGKFYRYPLTIRFIK